MALATTCAKPSTIWEYPDEGGINEFYAKLLNEANERYKFPFLLNQVATKPKIIRIFNKDTGEESFPMVYYMTHISIQDTNAVKAENIQIKKVLSTVLPGIDKDNQCVFYEAFNKFPNSSESVDRFTMIDRLK